MSTEEEKKVEELAVKELLFEAKRGRERSATMGPTGWQKNVPTTNKRFLQRTLASTLYSRKPKSSKDPKHSANDRKRFSDSNRSFNKHSPDGSTNSKRKKQNVSDTKDDSPYYEKKPQEEQRFTGTMKSEKQEKHKV